MYKIRMRLVQSKARAKNAPLATLSVVDVAAAVDVVKAVVVANATKTASKPHHRNAQKRVSHALKAALRVAMNAVRIATVARKKAPATRPTPTMQHLNLIAQPPSPTPA
jgi:hypothetical protein